MRTPFLIRAAEPADEQALAELDRRSWSPLHAVSPRPQPPFPPFFDSGHRPAHYLVAELRGGELPDGEAGRAAGGKPEGGGRPERAATGGVAGYVRLVPPTPLASNAHVRQIQGLVVDEAVRGRGMARALLDAACERAREQGAVRITLRVLGPNVPARGLYLAAGFEVEGVLPGEFLLDGEYVDDVLMGRRLD